MPRSIAGVYPSHLREANDRKQKAHSFRGLIEGKACSKCGLWKVLDDFPRRSCGPDGLENRCKTCVGERALAYYHKNKKKINEARRTPEYREAMRPYFAEYERTRRVNDPAYRLKKTLRLSLWKALKGKRRCAHTLELLGCSLEDFVTHIESQFTEGMNWDNYGRGGWEIDHIRPCASFDLLDPADQRLCFHHSNMQPLWGWDNWEKGASW